MIALAIMAELAAPPALPTATADNEIVVVGRKLASWRGSWRLRDDAVACKTRRSTGDKAVDAIGCDAMVRCIAPLTPQLAALEAADLSKAETVTRVNALLQDTAVYDCMTRTRNAGIEALVAVRRGRRS